MRPISARARGAAGFTMLEAVIASSLTLMLLGVAVPAFISAGDAGDLGAAHVMVESETRHALFRIARELENTSTTATDPLGNPRLTIVAGDDPDPIWDDDGAGGSDMGGFYGKLGVEQNTDNSNADNDADDLIAGTAATGATNAKETDAKGTGHRGTTQWGRDRSASLNGTDEIGRNSNRPRHADIPKNSVLTFQKVSGYTIDSAGAPVVSWTSPVELRVVNRKLMRTQDGQSHVVCPVCVGFKAELSDAGTVMITIVSQRRAHGKGRIVALANQIEVSPKN